MFASKVPSRKVTFKNNNFMIHSSDRLKSSDKYEEMKESIFCQWQFTDKH